MPLDVSTSPLKSFGHVVKLSGSLDTNTFGQLETEFQQLVKAETPIIVLDLGGLNYISSAGIRVVQKATRAMEKSGGQFKIVNPQPQVARVFEIIRVMPIGQMFGSMEELDAYLAKEQQRPPGAGPA